MKKNFNKIPGGITSKIEGIDSSELIVAAVIPVSQETVKANLYPDLGLKYEHGSLTFKNRFIPDIQNGRFSKRNIEGREIVRKDLPKVLKSIDMGERPIFGDSARNGTFNLVVDREVYQKEVESPKECSISIDVVGSEVNNELEVTFLKVYVDKTVSKDTGKSSNNLLFLLNLLQECVGQVDIFSSDVSNEELMNSQVLNWEIFPPGNSDRDLAKILNGVRKVTSQIRLDVTERYEVLTRLRPDKIIIGKGGLRGYFGAKFTDNLVVFENVRAGNALYVLYDNWKDLSKLSRTEIQAKPESEYDRITHVSGWQERLTNLVESKR